MTNTLPSVPTDSLYKFIAIFGIVLVGIGLWLPERFTTARAQQRDAYKARQLAKIRVDRKKARSDQAVEEFTKKSDALKGELEQSEAENEKLNVRLKALRDELSQIKPDATKSTALDLKRRAEAILTEQQAIEKKIHENVSEQKSLHKDFKALRVQLEDVADEFKADTIELKAASEAAKEFNEEADWWLELAAGSLLLGLLLIVLGFRWWYVRVQVHQDAILKRDAGVPLIPPKTADGGAKAEPT